MGECLVCPYGCTKCIDDSEAYQTYSDYSSNSDSFYNKYLYIFNNTEIKCMECRNNFVLD